MMIMASSVLSFYLRVVTGRGCSESEGEMKAKDEAFLRFPRKAAEVGVGTDSRLGRGRFLESWAGRDL